MTKLHLQFFGGRGASSSGASGGASSTGNKEYDSFLNLHANATSPDNIKVGDKVISRIVTEDGKRKLEKWKATGEDSIIGTFEPRNDITITKVTKTKNQVKLEGTVKGGYGQDITVSKTMNKSDKAYTRK